MHPPFLFLHRSRKRTPWTGYFVGIVIGSIAYLALTDLAFVENYREGKVKIEQTKLDVDRLDEQLQESEHAR
ncbi:TPA: hypothetical protein DCE37_14695 [Candidatus Latescibacteria bacterium]|nr:hypothetical protein [Candidatus Latescibacterota bacterium]